MKKKWLSQLKKKKLYTCTICGRTKKTVKKYSKGITFVLSDDKDSYIVTGLGTCQDKDIIIPPTYNQLLVTRIDESAFSECSSLISVVMPNSVTSIGDWAFDDCSGLTSTTIPNDVTSIRKSVFYNCGSLQYNEYGNCCYSGSEENPYLLLGYVKDKKEQT